LTVKEYEPGFFRTIAFPDPVFITETVGAACSTLQWGTLRWLTLGGYEALFDVYQRMPKKGEHPA
jgi:hypothetical protein